MTCWSMQLLTLFSLLLLAPAAADIESRLRHEWRQIVKACPDRTYKSCENIDKANWTDGKRTRRSDLVQLEGRWLTFTLETFDQHGNRKTKGGDSWFVVLRDMQEKVMLSTRVLDNADGTYTVAAVIMSPGNYSVLARLWYSDCHGVQEPALGEGVPLDKWYDILQKKDHCHIGTRIRLKTLLIEPGHASVQTCGTCEQATAAAKQTSGHSRPLATITRTDYYYYRKDGHLKSVDCCKPRLTVPPNPRRLFMCGDSTMRQQWNFLHWTARRPCRWEDSPRWMEELFFPERCPPAPMSEVDPALDQLYRRCTGGPSWSTVPLGVTDRGMLDHTNDTFYLNAYDHNSYNASWSNGEQLPRQFTVGFMDGWGVPTLQESRHNFLNPLVAGDMIVINRTHTFVQFQEYMDRLVNEMVHVKTRDPGVTILWRSSNIWKEYVFRNNSMAPVEGYIATGHFNTYLRGQLFDSYAEDVMSWAGIDIWDVYTITTLGDNRPWDMIHVDANTVRELDYDMLDQFACRA